MFLLRNATVSVLLSSWICVASALAADPSVTVVATPANVIEGTTTNIEFTITRDTVTASDLTVSLAYSGTATSGTDYATPPAQATILANNASVVVSFSLTNDSTSEPDETVILTLQSGMGYTVGSPASATVTIEDRDQTYISIAATDSSGAETGSDSATFTVSRIGDRSQAITVLYAVSGTAIAGTDYTALTGSVVMAAGAPSTTITVTPIDDVLWERGAESVVVTLQNNTGYAVQSPFISTIYIHEDEVAQFVLTEDDFTLKVDETVIVGVKLSVQPVEPVMVDVTRVSGTCIVSNSRLLFDATNWSTNQNVEMSAPSGGVYISSTFECEVAVASIDIPTATINLTVQPNSLPETSSILLRPDSFDAVQFSASATYRNEYLSKIRPGRVFLCAEPGSGVPVLKAQGSTQMSIVTTGTGGEIAVVGAASAPVTFWIQDAGSFKENLKNCITVQADASGIAKVNFIPERVGSRSTVLVASPLASSRVRFVIKGAP